MNWIQSLDTEIIFFFNELHTPWLNKLMVLVSEKWTWIPLYVALVAAYAIKFKKDSWKYLLLLVIGIALTDRISSGLAKPFFERLRPCHLDSIANNIELLVSCGGKYGFFSSHSGNAFVLAFLTAFVLKDKRWNYVLFSCASLVALSRVYLAKHYLTDILAGAVFGFLLAFLLVWGSRKIKFLG